VPQKIMARTELKKIVFSFYGFEKSLLKKFKKNLEFVVK